AAGKARLRGDCQRRDAERNPARRGRFDEVTARDSHCAASLLAEFILYSVRRDLLATASLTIFGPGSTRPAALRNFNAARVRFGSSSTHAVEMTRPCLSASPQKRPSQIKM